MYLYRVIDNERHKNGKLDNGLDGIGVNTFDYDEKEYIHFFILPESAEIYQLLRYKNNEKQSVVTKWDIPFNLIKDNFGIGMYRWYHPGRSPFLEVRINKKDLKKEMIIEIENEVCEEWKKEGLYRRYLKCIGELKWDNDCICPIIYRFSAENYTKGEEKIFINPEFNFLNYFPIDDLKKEGLTNDYGSDEEIIVEEDDKKNRKRWFKRKK